MLARAYDKIMGRPGAAAKLPKGGKDDSSFERLAKAFEELAESKRWNDVGPGKPLPTKPNPQFPDLPKDTPPDQIERWNKVAGREEQQELTALEQYEALLNEGKARKAGQFYADNREQIIRDLADRNEEHYRQMDAKWQR